MDEKEYEKAAIALAEATPRHLNQPTTPPIHWRVEGDQLRVLLADGRTVRSPFDQKKVKIISKQLMQLPIRDQTPLTPAGKPAVPSSPKRKKQPLSFGAFGTFGTFQIPNKEIKPWVTYTIRTCPNSSRRLPCIA